jgi:hypothetical protein
LTAEQKRQLVQRVVNAEVFRRSPAMRSFLLYIADHAILGHGERLKEQAIGADVLGRKPNYDPANDNIVRVRAHELRERLEKHFAGEGAKEPVVITVPRGTYVPEFVSRQAAQRTARAARATVPTSGETPQKAPVAWLRWLPVAVGLLTFVAVGITVTTHVMRANQRTGAARPNSAMLDFWGQFFENPEKEMKVVYADTNFALWQDINGKSLNLGDYLSHRYLDVHDDKLREVAVRRATSPADVSVSVHLAMVAAQFGGQISPQYARNVNVDFFHHGNIFLIGSHRSNPWAEVYETYLNFRLEQDARTGAPELVNRSPQPLETGVYAIPASLDTQGDEAKEFTSYGVLALLKGCGDRGLLVLDEGLNMQATEAIGDLVTDPQRLDAVERRIGHNPGSGNVAPFEALIQITSLPGGYNNPKVIAYRIRPAGSCVVN